MLIQTSVSQNKYLKHVFYVQSGIAYQVALNIISYYGLTPDQCIFLFGRSFMPDNKYAFLNLDTSSYVINASVYFWQSWPKTNHVVKKTYEFLNTQVKTNFYFYTSGLSHLFLRLLQKSRKCIKCCFIEEGISAYLTKRERYAFMFRNYIYSIPMQIFVIKKFLSCRMLYFHHPVRDILNLKDFDLIIGISESSFRGFRNRLILKNVKLPANNSYRHMKHLLAISFLIESKLINHTNYFRGLELFLNQLSDKLKGETLYYKLHPAHYTNPLFEYRYKDFLKKFEEKIDLQEISSDSIPEVILYNSKGTLYTDISSIAIYSKIFGYSVDSFSKHILKIDPKYINVLKQLPKELKDTLNEKEFFIPY